MAEKLFKVMFRKKIKSNCIRIGRSECTENANEIIKEKITIDFMNRGKFYSALFNSENCI